MGTGVVCFVFVTAFGIAIAVVEWYLRRHGNAMDL
jgi:hypothetical protein